MIKKIYYRQKLLLLKMTIEDMEWVMEMAIFLRALEIPIKMV
jgi:hypothetical protein